MGLYDKVHNTESTAIKIGDALMSPVRWSGRQVTNLGKELPEGNPLYKLAAVIGRIALAILGAVLFVPCGVLSLFGIPFKALGKEPERIESPPPPTTTPPPPQLPPPPEIIKVGDVSLRREKVPEDGNCFYHAVSKALKNLGKAELDHATLRATIAIFLEDEQGQDETINGLIATAITEHNEKIEEHIRNLNQNKEHLPDVQYEATLAGYQRNKIDSENYQGYVNYIKQADTHAGNPECQAVLASYQVNIQIIMEGSLYASFPPKKIEEFPTIYLLYTGNHYDLGVPVTDQ